MSLATLPSDLRLVVLAYCLTLYSSSGRPASARPPTLLAGQLPHQVAIRDGTLVINVSPGSIGRGVADGVVQPWHRLGSWLRWWWSTKRAQRLHADEQAWVDAIHHTAANILVLCLQARASLLPLLGIPIPLLRGRPAAVAVAPARSGLSRCRRTLAAITLAAVLGEIQLVSLVCAHRFFERRRRKRLLQLVIHGSSARSSARSSVARPASPPADGESTPATCPICAVADSEMPGNDPIESFCSAAPHQHLFHRSCLVRWLRTFTADQALDGSGGSEVVVNTARRTAGAPLASVPAPAREALQELLWRAGLFLDLRTKHEPVGRSTATGQPPPTRITLDPSAGAFLSQGGAPTASWSLLGKPPASFPASLGTISTSAPPCPSCRSPLAFRLSLARPDAEPGDKGFGTLWLATWSALVSGQTLCARGRGLAGAVVLLAVLQKLPSI